MRSYIAAAAALLGATLPTAAIAGPVAATNKMPMITYTTNVGGSFGNDNPTVYPPAFNDLYTFSTTRQTLATVRITSTMASLAGKTCLDKPASQKGCDFTTNVNFVSNGVLLNAKVVPVITSGVNEERYLANFRLPAGMQNIIVRGSAAENGTYAGLLSLSVVPEPATWALMIMGFGASGAALRRRRTTGMAAACA